MKEKITIIGAGNMGKAIAQRLLDKKLVSQNRLLLTNTRTKNNREIVQEADIIILAVKPQMMNSVLEEIKEVVSTQLIISIAAGISITSLQRILGSKSVVRVMPNLAAQVGESMSVWIANAHVNEKQKYRTGIKLAFTKAKELDRKYK